MKSPRLSPKAEDLLSVLTQKASAIELSQVTRHFCGDDGSNARRLVRLLQSRGLLRDVSGYRRRFSSVELLTTPLPEQPLPDAVYLSQRSRIRWLNNRPHFAKVFAATGQAAGLFGVPVARINPHQIGHDIAVCEVALLYRETRPELARLWRGETAIAKNRRDQKLPDAVLEINQIEWAAIEFASGYSVERIQAFMNDCRARNLPIELWS